MACLIGLSSCKEDDSRYDEPQEYVFGGNKVVIPPYFRFVVYKPKFHSLHVVLNLDNFQTVEKDYSPETKNLLFLEIRELRSEFGESKYWTDNDPILKTLPDNCKDYILGEEEYKFCENGDEVRAVDWGHDLYTIYKNNKEIPQSIIGCSDLDERKSLQKGCNVRANLDNGMQLEYHYKIEQLPHAFKLDYFVRHFVEGLIKERGK